MPRGGMDHRSRFQQGGQGLHAFLGLRGSGFAGDVTGKKINPWFARG